MADIKEQTSYQINQLNFQFRDILGELTTSFLGGTEKDADGKYVRTQEIDPTIWFPQVNTLLPHFQGHRDYRSETEIDVLKPDFMRVYASKLWHQRYFEDGRYEPKAMSRLQLELIYQLRAQQGNYDILAIHLNPKEPATGTRFIYSEDRRAPDYCGHDRKQIEFSVEQLEELQYIISYAAEVPLL